MSSDSDIGVLPQHGYSAKVEAYLHVQDRRLKIGRIGASALELRETCDVPASTNATVVVSVDGLEQRMPILLIHGISNGSAIVEFI